MEGCSVSKYGPFEGFRDLVKSFSLYLVYMFKEFPKPSGIIF